MTVRWGHRSLDTTNTKANVTRATRSSPAPAYDVRVHSVHWRKAKMHMHIPSSYINSYAYDRTAAINLQGILGMHLMCRVETGLSHENLPTLHQSFTSSQLLLKVGHSCHYSNLETSWLNGQHQSLTKVASNYS